MYSTIGQSFRYAATQPFEQCDTCDGPRLVDDSNQDGYASNATARGSLTDETTNKQIPEHVALSLANQADVLPRVQMGPTCGLYALGMVMDYWAEQDRSDTVAVRDDDFRRSDAIATSKLRATLINSKPYKNLLQLARRLGVTTVGELFDARYLAQVAIASGFDAYIIGPITYELLAHYTTRRIPILIAFDVDRNGNPGFEDGETAHWAVVQATYVHPSTNARRVIATHAWTGDEYDWLAQNLLDSNAQLQRTSFKPASHLNLGKTLARQAVVVVPKTNERSKAGTLREELHNVKNETSLIRLSITVKRCLDHIAR